MLSTNTEKPFNSELLDTGKPCNIKQILNDRLGILFQMLDCQNSEKHNSGRISFDRGVPY